MSDREELARLMMVRIEGLTRSVDELRATVQALLSATEASEAPVAKPTEGLAVSGAERGAEVRMDDFTGELTGRVLRAPDARTWLVRWCAYGDVTLEARTPRKAVTHTSQCTRQCTCTWLADWTVVPFAEMTKAELLSFARLHYSSLGRLDKRADLIRALERITGVK